MSRTAHINMEIVVRRCWPSMIRNLETPTGTLRAGIVTTAPIKWVALSLASSDGIKDHDVFPQGPPLLFRPGIWTLEQRHDILLKPAVIVDNEGRRCFHGVLLSLPAKELIRLSHQGGHGRGFVS